MMDLAGARAHRFGDPTRLAAAFAATLAIAFAGWGCSKHHSPTAPTDGAGGGVPNVAGIVRFADHTRAVGILVSLETSLGSAIPRSRTPYSDVTFTDSSGSFTFLDVPAGKFDVITGIGRDRPEITFFLTDSLVTSAAVNVVAAGVATPPLALTLGVPGVFTGRVVDAATSRAAEALVVTTGAIGITASDTDGVYVLPGVAPGSWPVLAIQIIDSTTVMGGQVAGVLASAGDTVRLPDIRLTLEPPVGGAHFDTPARVFTAAPRSTVRRELVERIAAIRERRAALIERLTRIR